MDELEHEEPEAESYLSDQPNTLEAPTTPPGRKAVFSTVFRTVLGPGIMLMITLLFYFLVYLATGNEPTNPLRLVASFLLYLFGAISVLWFVVGLVVLVLKLAKREQAAAAPPAKAPPKPKTKKSKAKNPK